MALDPIEKKPLYLFHPGSYILSVGSYGCNLRCPFCQNHEISMADSSLPTQYLSPENLTALALKLRDEDPRGNIGVAFTYNEPLISYEYLLDSARLLKEAGLCAVLVTNGTVSREPLLRLLPYIDAMNIDLKGFSAEFYAYVGGYFDCVKETIKEAAKVCHVEVTTLILAGKNDKDEMMEEEALFLSGISPDLPLHLSRAFPRFKEPGLEITPRETLERLRKIAQKHLKHVFLGNI